MKEVRLDVPEGYFEESFEKTLARSRGIRTRRRAVLGSAAALVLAVGIWQFLPERPERIEPDDETLRLMMAEVSEMNELDVFLMINGQ